MGVLALLYENVFKFLDRRGFTLAEHPKNIAEFERRLGAAEFSIFRGNRPAADIRGEASLICVVVAPDSEQSSKPDKFQKLLSLADVGSNSAHTNLIIFAGNDPSTFIQANIRKFSDEHPKTLVEFLSHRLIMYDITNHVLVPHHRIAPLDEVDAFCRLTRINKHGLQRILSSDPQALWLGVRPNMVVAIDRVSESAGMITTYRICVSSTAK